MASGRLLSLFVLVLGVLACEAGGGRPGPPSDTGPTLDGTAPDTNRADTASPACMNNADCDDAVTCTTDTCALGGICRHMPIDGICGAGERCSLTAGCITGCSIDADCDDGVFCNGVEQCVPGPMTASCFMGTAPDCEDGNMCTVDTCDPMVDGCRYATAPGCDAGIMPPDTGPPCDPFDPSMHYSGTFSLLPVQASSCPGVSYNISSVSFTRTASTLTVQAGSFTLTQSPAPTVPDFSVQLVRSGCVTYELSGTFSCTNRFMGTWRSTTSGTCASCSSQNATVVGIGR